MVNTSTFRVTLDSESVDTADVIVAWQNITNLLTAIERAVVGEGHSSVHWHAEHDPVVEITASVNGVNKEQLDTIVHLAADGLVTGSRSGRYPEAFGADAIHAAQNILRLLQRAESLTVYADNYGEQVIRTAHFEEDVIGQTPRRQVYSSIEGVLRMLSSQGKGYTASIRDRVSDVSVLFSFELEHLEKIKELFDKNVVAEGVILFKDGVPLRFVETPDVRERARNRPLRSFIGVLPALTNGETAEDFLERLHDGTTPVS